jgi:hypothetical protein
LRIVTVPVGMHFRGRAIAIVWELLKRHRQVRLSFKGRSTSRELEENAELMI